MIPTYIRNEQFQRIVREVQAHQRISSRSLTSFGTITTISRVMMACCSGSVVSNVERNKK